LWITDFGLAHCQNQVGLTMTGDLVGTLRYMSPEQALAKRVPIDHRTDIYSLGVTLYELLTLEPVFPGRDRQELLRQIAFEEPRVPRRWNRNIPAELETIVLKAIAKNPAERYATAQELADDLRRFLEDKPIRAKRPTIVQRARKWARRHRPVVLAAAIVLVLTSTLLAGTGIWYARQRATRLADTERGVTAALAKATIHLDEGDKAIDDPVRWQNSVQLARLAVEQAKEFLATGEPTAELANQVEETEARLEIAETDSQLRAQLERIVLTHEAVLSGGWNDHAQVVPQYARILHDYGVNLTMPEEAAARVRGSRIREVLMAAIEDWWRFSPNETEQRRLEQVLWLSEPDPDAFRWKWVKAAGPKRRDGAALKKLADQVVVAQLSATALLNMIMDLREVAQLGPAERLLREGLELHPGNFWINLHLGAVLVLQGPARTDEARNYFQAALALHGPDPVIYHNLAYSWESSDVDKAIRYYEAALRSSPNLWQAHNNLGRLLLEKKEPDRAIQQFQNALRINSRDDVVLSNLCLALRRKGDLEGAIREGQAAIKLNPNNAEAHNNLGLAIVEKGGNLEGGIREYQAALKINPKYATAYYNLGIALRAKGDPEGAIQSYRTAIQFNTREPDYHTNLANLLSAKGKRDEAMREFQAAIQLDPQHVKAHVGLGVVLMTNGDLDGAIREFEAATRIEPGYGLALFNLALCHSRKHNVDAAIREWQVFLKIEPNLAEAHSNLAWLLGEKGDLEGAIREFQTAIKFSPKLAKAHHNLGVVLKRKRDLDGAAREFQATTEADPNFAEAYCDLGLIRVQQGRLAEALPLFKTGHELAAKQQDWNRPSALWIQLTERLVQMDSLLPKVISGQVKPKDGAEALELAKFCQEHMKRYAAAAHFYSAAFVLAPKAADDQDGARRYNAACAAALAGCGEGEDAATLDEKERAELRQQALDWLRADFAYYVKLAEGGPAEIRDFVKKRLQQWLNDMDFAGVRGQTLAQLPGTEREAWQQLWTDVEKTLRKAESKSTQDTNKKA
jgi:tetratricopeptide (TPR) repeat protein